MTPEQMAAQCTTALQAGKDITLTQAKGQRMPHGFPRGVMLSESRRDVVMTYKPGHILNWLRTTAQIPAFEAEPKRAGR